MGKIADRLANKSHPLYATSKQLFKDYRLYWDLLDAVPADEDGDPFEDSEEYIKAESHYELVIKRMEDVLKSSSGADFLKWLELLELHAGAVADSEELLSLFLEEWAEIAMITRESTKVRSGALVALPVRVQGKKLAWHINIPTEKQDELTRLLQKYEFVGEGCEVRYLPRLLSVNESLFLDYHTLYHIRKAFIQNNPRLAYRLMLERRMLAGAGLPDLSSPEEDGNSSMGLLIAYIECDDMSEALPIENQIQTEDHPSQIEIMLKDVDVICGQMGGELSSLLGVQDMIPTQHVCPIYKARHAAAHDERRFYFVAQLADHGWEREDARYLKVANNFNVLLDQSLVEMQIWDSRGDAQKGVTVEWLKFYGESIEDAMNDLTATLAAFGIEVNAVAAE